MSTKPGPETAAPADPEHDPTATYALAPSLVRSLAARITAAGHAHTTYAPFTGQPIASLSLSTPDDVVAATAAARAAQRHWARVPLELRAQVLLNLHDLVLDRQADILDLIQWESGKSRKNAFEEVGHVAMTARYYGRLARRYLGTSRKNGMFPLFTRVDVNRVPKGVVGIISPWNYPFTMAISDGLPALLAGNAILHKPDIQTPLSALWGVDLLVEAGMPADAWQVVYGEGPVVGAAVLDQADYICFTGSTATGRLVATRCAERLIGCSLELGGKNPMLVLRDADLDRAADGAVRACFSSAGQLCVSMERMYVADQIYDRFMERFLRRVEAMQLTTSLDYSGDVGSLVSAAQLETVERHVDDARAQGAAVLAGGRARPDVGPLFYEPTVLSGVRPGMECFAHETFGPVVSVYRFGDEADAVARANDGEFGLNASIFSRDTAGPVGWQARSGAARSTSTRRMRRTFGSIDAPMGGMRSSGLGRRQGPEGIQRYTDAQAIGTQRLLPDGASARDV